MSFQIPQIPQFPWKMIELFLRNDIGKILSHGRMRGRNINLNYKIETFQGYYFKHLFHENSQQITRVEKTREQMREKRILTILEGWLPCFEHLFHNLSQQFWVLEDETFPIRRLAELFDMLSCKLKRNFSETRCLVKISLDKKVKLNLSYHSHI